MSLKTGCFRLKIKYISGKWRSGRINLTEIFNWALSLFFINFAAQKALIINMRAFQGGFLSFRSLLQVEKR